MSDHNEVTTQTEITVPERPVPPPKIAAVETLRVPTVARDTPWGHWYSAKCWVQTKHINRWEPKEPQDSLFRTFVELCEEIDELASGISELDESTDRVIKRIYGIFASKGGSGKTPTSAQLAALFKYATQLSTLIGDFNHNNGTTGKRMGVERSGKNVKLLFDVLRDHSLIENHDTATDHFPKHKETKVDVLLSNNTSNQSEGDEKPAVRQVIDTLFKLKDAYNAVFCDTGNGNAHPINEGAMFSCDVAGFTLMADKKDQFLPLLDTLIEFAKLGHHEKVKAAPKIICATRKDDKPSKFLERFRVSVEEYLGSESMKWCYVSPGTDMDRIIDYRTDLKDVEAQKAAVDAQKASMVEQLMVDHGITENNIFMVPFSAYIHTNGITSLKRRNTGMPALIAYARILKHMLEIPVPTIDEKKQYINDILDDRVVDQEALALQRAGDKRIAEIKEFYAKGERASIEENSIQAGLKVLGKAYTPMEK